MNQPPSRENAAVITWIGLIGSLLTIFTFTTGVTSIAELLKSSILAWAMHTGGSVFYGLVLGFVKVAIIFGLCIILLTPGIVSFVFVMKSRAEWLSYLPVAVTVACALALLVSQIQDPFLERLFSSLN